MIKFSNESIGLTYSLPLLPHVTDWSNCLVVRRWVPNSGVPCSKPLGDSKVDSAFHPSEVDEMNINL